jgi:hypothetical protein
MFKRLLLDDSTAIFVLTAFVTASTIFLLITWRALRMPRAQVDNFANLPFNSENAAGRHDTHA